ncbi:C39 family peptidase [Nakamurella leprariae]|uniref:C39 family peptidase n=1 Tax=Nakamurella leprariae TaxID=2803911 RepID=A0A939C2U1_9ACTN|nr:C39 family peptidase [Nakamurella leprariae]MBM9468654.1 C39 family peptidase [Nakamurella leprariae]
MSDHDVDTIGSFPDSQPAETSWDPAPDLGPEPSPEQVTPAEMDPFPIQPGLPGFDDRPDDLPFDPVDPASVVVDPAADTVSGDPLQDDDYWLFQGAGQGTCAPTSVAMVLADVLGVPVGSNQEVVDRALELGLIEYDPEQYQEFNGWSGMDDRQIMALAESYGLDVHLRYGDIDDLADALDAGHAVMAAVDAHEIWSVIDDDLDPDDAGIDENHELVVTGIDRTNGLVYLNDSGREHGGTIAIPLEQFADAWADSGNSMIVTDLPEDQAAAGVVAELSVPGAEPGTADQSAAVAAPTAIPAAVPAAASPIPVDLDAISAGAGPIEGVDSFPEGVVRLLILPFTFVVDLVDRLT